LLFVENKTKASSFYL